MQKKSFIANIAKIAIGQLHFPNNENIDNNCIGINIFVLYYQTVIPSS